MNHLMVDLETMGNGPYAPVISIGAVFFDSILHSAMHSLMNSQDRDTRDRSLNDDNVLEISEPRI